MRPRQRSSHPFAVVVVLALAAALGAVAIASIWANRQLLETRGWVAVSGRMLDSADVRHRVAAFLAEELIAETEGRLRAAGQDEVAAKVVPQLRRRGPALAERAVASPQFRFVWLRANRIGHRVLLRVLDEEGGLRRGPVAIDLTPALRELADSLSDTELGKALGAGDLPESLGAADLGALVEPGAARLEVLEADELDQAQEAVRAIRQLPVPATIAVLVLFGLALALGRAQLRRTVLGVGLSLAAAGALALLARLVAGHEIADALLDGHADREAAEAAWRIATSTVVDLAVGAICLGALVALWAMLTGESALAFGLRRGLAPLLRTPLTRVLMLLAAVLLFLLILAWSPIAAFDDPLGVVLFAAAFGAGALALARKTIVEEGLAPH